MTDQPLRLAFEEWGSGPRRALLIHGISSNAAGWWRLGPDLAALGYRVVAPDLRGHGRSPSATDHTLAAHVADLAELGTSWDLVLGHSLGGAIALACFERNPVFGERLVLEDPLVVMPEGGAPPWLYEPFAGPMTPDRVAADHPEWHPTDAAIKADALRQTSPEVVTATLAHAWDLREVAAGLRVPTLLLGADPDLGALVSPAEGEALAAANRRVDFRVVHGAGHSMHRDRYDDFWTIVGELLTEG